MDENVTARLMAQAIPGDAAHDIGTEKTGLEVIQAIVQLTLSGFNASRNSAGSNAIAVDITP